jgi:hypothetical protein
MVVNQINRGRTKKDEPETERNFKLYEHWKTGRYTKAKLGRIFKITRERVNQIIVNAERAEIICEPSYPCHEDPN